MLRNQNLDSACIEALMTFGALLQVEIAIEENSELIKALCKLLRSDQIPKKMMLDTPEDERRDIFCSKYRSEMIDEIADVHIMLRQLELIYGCDYEVNEREKYKIERLKERINENTKGLLGE